MTDKDGKPEKNQESIEPSNPSAQNPVPVAARKLGGRSEVRQGTGLHGATDPNNSFPTSARRDLQSDGAQPNIPLIVADVKQAAQRNATTSATRQRQLVPMTQEECNELAAQATALNIVKPGLGTKYVNQRIAAIRYTEFWSHHPKRIERLRAWLEVGVAVGHFVQNILAVAGAYALAYSCAKLAVGSQVNNSGMKVMIASIGVISACVGTIKGVAIPVLSKPKSQGKADQKTN